MYVVLNGKEVGCYPVRSGKLMKISEQRREIIGEIQ